MLGVHYKAPVAGNGVVAYESNDQSGLCCNLQRSDMSRNIGIPVSDENLQIGSVLNQPHSGHFADRLPALIAETLRYDQ